MQIEFVNTKEGRLITRLLATFEVQAESEQETTVCLDARIKAKQLPPPPFKGMVKGMQAFYILFGHNSPCVQSFMSGCGLSTLQHVCLHTPVLCAASVIYKMFISLQHVCLNSFVSRAASVAHNTFVQCENLITD